MIIALCFYQITAIVEEKSSWILHVQCMYGRLMFGRRHSVCWVSSLYGQLHSGDQPGPGTGTAPGCLAAAVMTHSASSIYNCGVCGPEAADKWNKMNESPTMTMSYLFSKLFRDLICVPQSPFNPIHGMHELLDTFCVIYEGPVWKD